MIKRFIIERDKNNEKVFFKNIGINSYIDCVNP